MPQQRAPHGNRRGERICSIWSKNATTTAASAEFSKIVSEIVHIVWGFSKMLRVHRVTRFGRTNPRFAWLFGMCVHFGCLVWRNNVYVIVVYIMNYNVCLANKTY